MEVFDKLTGLFESVLEYLEKDTAEEYIRMWNAEIERISKKYDIMEMTDELGVTLSNRMMGVINGVLFDNYSDRE